MTTPVRTRTTRPINPSVPPSEDTTKSKVVIPEGTKAQVTEQIGAKSVTYEAEVKEDEVTPESESIDLEDLLSHKEEDTEPEKIPVSKLDKYFNQLRTAVSEGKSDNFYATVTRTFDSLGDSFFRPSQDEYPLGTFQFRTTSQFDFMAEIQKLNSNSGGRFHVRTFGTDRQPLRIYNPNTFRKNHQEVVIANLFVPNPTIQVGTENHTAQNNPLATALVEIAKMTQEGNRQILEAINRRPEKSSIEQLIEQKTVEMLFNNNSNNNSSSDMERSITTALMGPMAVERILNRVLPENPAPPAPETGWDRAARMLETPAGQGFVERVGDAVEKIPGALLMMKATSNGNGQPMPSPFNEPDRQPMQNTAIIQEEEELTPAEELLNLILDELDTENPLNAENETIKQLGTDFALESTILVSMCKSMPFVNIVQILQSRYPFAFEGMYESKGVDEKQQPIIGYTETGERRMKRLEEFYEFVKTT